MKNYLYITISLLFFSSCKKFVNKDDINPNEPLKATLKTLLPVVEIAVFATYTGQVARNAGIFTQHFAGTDQQMVDVGLYQIVETDVTNDWTTIYNAGIRNANELILTATNEKSPYYAGIGRINKALLLGLATDLWGDVPNRKAGLGVEDLNPAYDPQQQIINDIQNDLSLAIQELKFTSSISIPSSDDFIHSGNNENWIITAWIIKARYANRLSKRDPILSANLALQYLDSAYAAGLNSSAQNANAKFSQKGNELNSWYAFESQRANYLKLSSKIIDTLKSLDDPRIIVYAKPDDDGSYSGTPLGETNTNTSSIGDFFSGDPSMHTSALSLPLVSFVEAKFIDAEASLRIGNKERSEKTFSEAVKSSLNLYINGIPSDSTNYYTTKSTAYLLLHGKLVGTDNGMFSQIMFQKWLALFTQPEIWSDWRRTGYPTLRPNPNASINEIPRRYPTEQRERVNNTNAKVVSDILVPVWWDK